MTATSAEDNSRSELKRHRSQGSSAVEPGPQAMFKKKPIIGDWLRRNSLRLYMIAAFVYIFAPIAYVTVFSFNKSTKTNILWNGFTFENWANPCSRVEVCKTVGNSLTISIVATAIATLLGTLMAFALARYKYTGRGTTSILLFLPMATPEVVLGGSLLALFLNWQFPLGYWTVVLAHVLFCISFVVVTVKARVQSLDPRLEQAAQDLYANEAQTFWRITFPLVAPAIGGAALLAFSLSFDDFIITNFVSGDYSTFPTYVYAASAKGIRAQVYVIGAGMFFIALLLSLVGDSLRRKKSS